MRGCAVHRSDRPVKDTGENVPERIVVLIVEHVEKRYLRL